MRKLDTGTCKYIYLNVEVEIDRKAVASELILGGSVSMLAEDQFLVEVRGSLLAFKMRVAQSFHLMFLEHLLEE